MKTVIFIGGETAPLLYFANVLEKQFDVALVVIERKKAIAKKSSSEKIQRSFLEKTFNYLSFRLKQRRELAKQKLEAQNLRRFQEELFGKDLITKLNIDNEKFLYTDNINSTEVVERLQHIKPDFILDHGTSIVKPKVLLLAKLALNLHWGLSPYYRGVMCTNQALLNWDINNIGVTIHKLSEKIDGGDILCQKRVAIVKEDNIGSITSKLTLNGTHILMDALKKYKQGKELKFHIQDFSSGFITRGVNWNVNLSQFIAELNEELLTQMIAKPSRGPAPIIELED